VDIEWLRLLNLPANAWGHLSGGWVSLCVSTFAGKGKCRVLADTGKQRALQAMLDGSVSPGAGDWTVEVELVASWLAKGSRWSALRSALRYPSGFWRGFFRPFPVVRRQTWTTIRKPIDIRMTSDGFTNTGAVSWDLGFLVPLAPKGSKGWVPTKANIYRGDDLMFWFHTDWPERVVLPGDGISFAPGAIVATLDGVG